jgi:two-component system, LytTR family, response regulator
MKICCLIIDDKPLAIDILSDYVQKISFFELVATTQNPIEGLSIIRAQKIDLVFLDIQMPELSGLQFMKIVGGQCKFILTTAYAEFALEGYEHDVVDYLLKPVSFDRFYRAAEKAKSVLQHLPPSPEFKERQSEYLFVKTEHRVQKIMLTDIKFIEGLQNYVAIHTATEKIMILQSMKKMISLLPANEFVRVSKSYIVALRHISSVERSRIFIGSSSIPIGDNYREPFYRLINFPG